MRNDVTSGVTSGVSNVTFINNAKQRYYYKVWSVSTLMARVPINEVYSTSASEY